MKILVTAGPTCEDLDPVRYLTNRSTGRMGYAIAAEAAGRGHEVVLVSGPVGLEPPSGVRLVRVRSAAEMLDACLAAYPDVQAAFLVAAVADFRPSRPSARKRQKSQSPLVLELERTEDIASRLGAAKGSRVLVGFALETDAARVNAARKLADKYLDAIVLNGPETFGSERIQAEILEQGRPWQRLAPQAKADLAGVVLDLVERRAGEEPEVRA